MLEHITQTASVWYTTDNEHHSIYSLQHSRSQFIQYIHQHPSCPPVAVDPRADT